MSRVRGVLPTWARAVTAAAVALAASLTTAASPAAACSCKSSGPACQAYWNTDAVFDATVVRIERVPRDELVGNEVVTGSKHLVTLDVRQTWKGLESGRLQVVTEAQEAACGFEFKDGVRYLVFARHGRSGELEVSLCSATREFDGTGDAAEFLARRMFRRASTHGLNLNVVTRPAAAERRVFRGVDIAPELYGFSRRGVHDRPQASARPRLWPGPPSSVPRN